MFSMAPAHEVVVVGDTELSETGSLLDRVKEGFRPFTVSMLYNGKVDDIQKLIPAIANYATVDGKPAAYVCRNFACSYPVTDAADLGELLQ